MPWLRENDSGADQREPVGLIKIDPKNYYGAASDYSAGGAAYGTLRPHAPLRGRRRLHDGAAPAARYDRDQRAATIRFCVARPTRAPAS